MSPMPDDGGDQRRAPRYAFPRRVRVRLQSWAQFSSLFADNISGGGLFIRMTDPPEAGVKLSVEVFDIEGRTMVLPGEVAHRVAGDPRTSGIGIRFVDLSDAERAMLDMLVDEAQQVGAKGSNPLPPAEPVPPAPPPAASLRIQLQARLELLRDADVTEALGVAKSASLAELKRGLDTQLKRYHPSRFANEPAEIRDLAIEICRALRAAYAAATR